MGERYIIIGVGTEGKFNILDKVTNDLVSNVPGTYEEMVKELEWFTGFEGDCCSNYSECESCQ